MKNIANTISYISKLLSKKSTKHTDNSTPEQQILKHLVDFRDLKVSEIMIPRPEIISVKNDIRVQELYDIFTETSFTRVPVHNGTTDEMIGFIHVKDFLPYTSPGGNHVAQDFDISKILRKLIYVPRSTKCIDLLNKMRKEATHIAVILDEYGGTEGIAMIELLIEEIVGDIRDEHDIGKTTPTLITKTGKNSYLIDARATIEKIEEVIGERNWLSDEEGEYETIGGFILSYLNRIPTKGESFTHHSNAKIDIVEAEPRRVKLVKLVLPDDQ